MGTYGISFIEDCELAAEQGFMLVTLPTGDAWIFYRQSSVCPKVLEDSWEAYREITGLGDGPDPGDPKIDPCQLRLVI